ncbi:MAG: hypothetical protein ACOC44_07365 [Promethearchaeia archaeon]
MTLKICPKCKKPTLKQATNVSGWLAPEMYECTNCNYVGALYLEVELGVYKEFQKEEKRKMQEEATKKEGKNEDNDQKD